MRDGHFNDGNALSTLKGWSEDQSLAVLAVHTTDFKGPVIELALLDCDGTALFEERFSTDQPIAAGATAQHGLDSAQLEGKPTLQERWPALVELLRGKTVLAYSPAFVVKALKASLDLGSLPAEDRDLIAALDTPEKRVIEAVAWVIGKPGADPLRPGFSYVKLTEAYTQLVGPDLLGSSAADNALRLLRVVCKAGRLSPADVPHLLPAFSPELPQEEQQQPAEPEPVPWPEPLPEPEPEPLPAGLCLDTASAVAALVKAGLLSSHPQGRACVLSLPDHSFYYSAQPQELQPGKIHTGLDKLCQAACEHWLHVNDQHLSLAQSVHWALFEPVHYARLATSALGGVSIDKQPAAGIALVNLLLKAGLAGLK